MDGVTVEREEHNLPPRNFNHLPSPCNTTNMQRRSADGQSRQGDRGGRARRGVRVIPSRHPRDLQSHNSLNESASDVDDDDSSDGFPDQQPDPLNGTPRPFGASPQAFTSNAGWVPNTDHALAYHAADGPYVQPASYAPNHSFSSSGATSQIVTPYSYYPGNPVDLTGFEMRAEHATLYNGIDRDFLSGPSLWNDSSRFNLADLMLPDIPEQRSASGGRSLPGRQT